MGTLYQRGARLQSREKLGEGVDDARPGLCAAPVEQQRGLQPRQGNARLGGGRWGLGVRKEGTLLANGIRVTCSQCSTAYRIESGMEPGETASCPKCGARAVLPPLQDAETALAHPTLASGSETPTLVRQPDDAATETFAPAPPTPGRYDERGLIGRGGMGEVVLCVDRNTRREIALKRMLPEAAADPARSARFVEEAQVTAQLEHPNIVPVHELDRSPDGSAYFTMKLVQGKSLADILKDLKTAVGGASLPGGTGILPVRHRRDACATGAPVSQDLPSLGELLQIFLKVCDGVAFAHSRGVIHRDLTPANIMVGDYGEVLVMDWGLAKLVKAVGRRPEAVGGEEAPLASSGHASRVTSHESSDRIVSDRQEAAALQTLAGSMMGTPAYMSPEQAKGELDHIDARSDLWSLGAILYEILTLERAVTGDTTYAILANVLKGRIVPPEQRAPGRNVPRELSAIVMKCLHKGRAHRYRSVLDLKRDLALYLEGRSVSAAPDTFAQASVKLIKRNKPVSAAIAAAAVILIVVTTIFLVNLTRERNEAVRARNVADAQRKEAQAARERQAQDALDASRVLGYQAIRAAEEGRLTEADARAEAARTFLPNGPWGYYALAQIAMQRQDAAAAREQIDEALRRDPSHEPSKAALSRLLGAAGEADRLRAMLARAEAAKDWRTIISTAEALISAGAPADALQAYDKAIALMEKDPTVERKLLDEKEKRRAQVQDRIFHERAKALCVGFYDSIRKLPVEEQQRRIAAKFTEVHGTPIRVSCTVDKGVIAGVGVGNQSVRSLEPLKGMPLTWLDCHATPVGDLGPLKGMPLTTLSLHSTQVSDLGPLRGMPLRELHCGRTQVSDLGPLKGMPLTTLDCNSAQVSDLGPLKGMPLTTLDCSSTPVSDLGPLEGMRLTLLLCRNTQVSDLGPLKGMPLTTLNCNETQVSDLGPLKSMALTTLNCSSTPVSDLGPLEGMPLTCLNCSVTRVSDLGPLRGMPLTGLFCTWTRVSDLGPLEGMKLEQFIFPAKNIKKGIEGMRQMKSIRQIGHHQDHLLKPEEFWRKYDAGEFK